MRKAPQGAFPFLGDQAGFLRRLPARRRLPLLTRRPWPDTDVGRPVVHQRRELPHRGPLHSAKPLPSGQTALTLAPLELLDRLAALIPPPRRHRHHRAGVFARHANLRARVTARAGRPVTEATAVTVPAPDLSLAAAQHDARERPGGFACCAKPPGGF